MERFRGHILFLGLRQEILHYLCRVMRTKYEEKLRFQEKESSARLVSSGSQQRSMIDWRGCP